MEVVTRSWRKSMFTSPRVLVGNARKQQWLFIISENHS